MSGTSLDGLDLCAAEFKRSGDRWTYRIRAFETVSYRGTHWPERLAAAYIDRGALRTQISLDFASWCQDQWLSFNARHHFAAHAVAHHGHTVEHDPSRGITVQIGHEALVFASSPIPVVGDFRSGSVARGGQGAPLVPLADRDLFADFAVCVNLGGFSNASWTDAGGLRRAGDLGPCNGLLNPLAGELGLDYDPEGQHAARGRVASSSLASSSLATSSLANPQTSQQPTSQSQPISANEPISAHLSQRANEPISANLSHLNYYSSPFPKSLGREWMEREFWPVFNSARPQRTEDALATASAHIAWSIVHGLRTAHAPHGKALLSGGGARNAHLVRQLCQIAPEWHWMVAPDDILESKEALAFAYLGLLRLRNEPNVLASYAGGQNDGCDGTVFGKFDKT
jgi:anhydro-N-acetylmuramic acid kinase